MKEKMVVAHLYFYPDGDGHAIRCALGNPEIHDGSFPLGLVKRSDLD
ncbi:MAG: hypothetical protein KGI38_13160 [Thaumarchaeota archaeon]|nr:hypothetical protein [Nitrososphaerota archaeon]